MPEYINRILFVPDKVQYCLFSNYLKSELRIYAILQDYCAPKYFFSAFCVYSVTVNGVTVNSNQIMIYGIDLSISLLTKEISPHIL